VRKLKLGDEEVGILARMLRKVEFFSPLTVGQLDQVLPHIALYELDAGETVFKQGDAGDAFYIIYKGSASVRVKKGFFSFAKTVAKVGEGAFFGEIALISSDPRNATIVCEEKSQLFVLVAEDFRFVLRENPAAEAEMKSIAARRKFESKHAQ
jgi:trk system potassium uptake protein TrkA